MFCDFFDILCLYKVINNQLVIFKNYKYTQCNESNSKKCAESVGINYNDEEKKIRFLKRLFLYLYLPVNEFILSIRLFFV